MYITKNSYIFIIGFITLSLIASCKMSDSSSRSSPKKNVLFITVDGLRPVYSDSLAIAPNIHKLGNMGFIFKKAYCQAAVCNPSRASVLTGLRPDQSRVTDMRTNFRETVPNIVTLPQLFKKNGYLSIDVGKIFHDGKHFQDRNSWSLPAAYELVSKKDQYFLPKHRKGGKSSSMEFVNVPDNYYVDGITADAGVEWIKKFQSNKQPFFLALGFRKPHLPFCAPKKYWDLYKNKDFTLGSDSVKPVGAPEIAFQGWDELRGYTDIPDTGNLYDAKIKELRRGYYAGVSYVDAQIGKVLEALKKSGLAQNTIIVLWADHGFHIGEQHLWGKSTNFELDTHVPLIIYTPDMSENGRATNAVVEALDIYPTLVDLCNLKPTDSLSGVSLRPLLENPDMKWKRVAYSQFPRPYSAMFSKFCKKAKYMGYTVRTEDWRCTAWFNRKTGLIDYTELYHLVGNNIEKVNVSGEKKYTAIETKLIHLLKKYKNKRYAKID